jgi:hypothetical protein
MEATKRDAGKIRYSLIPVLALQELAHVYTKGAAIYGDHNWRNGMSYTRCCDALSRHLQQWLGGEDFDQETQCHHLAAVAFYCFAVIHFHFTGTGTDDRPYIQDRRECDLRTEDHKQEISPASGKLCTFDPVNGHLSELTEKSCGTRLGGSILLSFDDGDCRHGFDRNDCAQCG